jgi:hypothetical protein
MKAPVAAGQSMTHDTSVYVVVKPVVVPVAQHTWFMGQSAVTAQWTAVPVQPLPVWHTAVVPVMPVVMQQICRASHRVVWVASRQASVGAAASSAPSSVASRLASAPWPPPSSPLLVPPDPLAELEPSPLDDPPFELAPPEPPDADPPDPPPLLEPPGCVPLELPPTGEKLSGCAPPHAPIVASASPQTQGSANRSI